MSPPPGVLETSDTETVESFGGTPHILFETSTVSPIDDLKWAKMYYIFMCNRQLFSERYHKRSNVESVFSMVEGRFGDLVGFKSDGGRPNEVLAKVSCHKGWALMRAAHDLDIEPPVRAGSGDGPKLSS
jgi:transposase